MKTRRERRGKGSSHVPVHMGRSAGAEAGLHNPAGAINGPPGDLAGRSPREEELVLGTPTQGTARTPWDAVVDSALVFHAFHGGPRSGACQRRPLLGSGAQKDPPASAVHHAGTPVAFEPEGSPKHGTLVRARPDLGLFFSATVSVRVALMLMCC